MSVAPVNQKFIVEGELQVVCTTAISGDGQFESKGIIRLTDQNDATLGSIRGLANSQYRALVFDSTGMSSGTAIRTQKTQGPSMIGGNFDKYALSCSGQTTTVQTLSVIQDSSYNGVNQEYGTTLLRTSRSGTSLVNNPGGSTAIATFYQGSKKDNENICVDIGLSSKSVVGTIGYNAYTVDTNDLLWFGWRSRTSTTTIPTKALTINQTGNVNIPLKLTAGTIYATTYQNLPPTDITPIYLDKTNSRVGIGTATPDATLQVAGDFHVDNISATNVAGTLTTAAQPNITSVGTLTNVNTSGVYRIGGNDILAVRNTGSVALGQGAAATSQGTNAVAIGNSAGNNTQGSNAVALGLNAGVTSQGASAVAVGQGAGNNTQGSAAVAVGQTAGFINQGLYGVAIGIASGATSQSQDAVAVGRNAGNNTQGQNAVAIGVGAGYTNQHANSIILNATGSALNSDGTSRFYVKPVRNLVDPTLPRLSYNATTGEICYGDSTTNSLLPITLDKVNNRVGINNVSPQAPLHVEGNIRAGWGTSSVAIGENAGWGGGTIAKQGISSVAIGTNAGNTSQGGYTVAVGSGSGFNTQGQNATSIGHQSGNTNQGIGATAVGYYAGRSGQMPYCVAVGYQAGLSSQSDGAVAIGADAGGTNQGASSVAIGQFAGQGNSGTGIGQGWNAVAIGREAGTTAQGRQGVAIGYQAGNATQGLNAMAIGNQAGKTSQADYGIALGFSAGNSSQGPKSVAIGANAGQTSQGGTTGQAVAIGNSAGNSSQGLNSVAIGNNAAYSLQSAQSVAIGNNCASTSQGGASVAIGATAGNDTQGSNCIAIGVNAGKTKQGGGAVAIGALAGETNQHANSLILNATGAALNSDGISRFYVKPVRNDTTVTNFMGYNPTSGEITYGNVAPVGPTGPQGPQGPAGTISPSDLIPITLDKTNNRVGIALTTPSPSDTLSVEGTIGATSFISSSLGMFPGGATGAVIKSGTGSPEGQKVGTVGSLYLRTDGTSGTSLYTKTSGSDTTGWTALNVGPIPTPSINVTTQTAGTLSAGVYKNFCTQTIQPGYYTCTAVISTPSSAPLNSFDIVVQGKGVVASTRYNSPIYNASTTGVFYTSITTTVFVEAFATANMSDLGITFSCLKLG